MNFEIYFLHGFLGQAADWIPLEKQIQQNITWNSIELFQDSKVNPSIPLFEWAQSFKKTLPPKNSIRVLIGYSMGGRLALHSFFNDPDLWDAAVFISTHPGLDNEEEKKNRVENDLKWKNIFLSKPWEEALSLWNSQEVFKNSSEPSREERSYSKEILSLALENWSLGRQENFVAKLQATNKPFLWIVGDQDQKFLELGKKISAQEKLAIIKNQGHRLIFGQDLKQISGYIAHFLKSLQA